MPHPSPQTDLSLAAPETSAGDPDNTTIPKYGTSDNIIPDSYSDTDSESEIEEDDGSSLPVSSRSPTWSDETKPNSDSGSDSEGDDGSDSDSEDPMYGYNRPNKLVPVLWPRDLEGEGERGDVDAVSSDMAKAKSIECISPADREVGWDNIRAGVTMDGVSFRY